MAKNYRQKGAVLDWTNDTGSTVESGSPVAAGDTVGVALVDIADTETGALAVEGTFVLPKAAGTAWSVGQRLDWDADAVAFDVGVSAATGDVIGGAIAAEDVASDAVSGAVLLCPGAGSAG